jgi:hypothetical protein
MPSPFLIRFKVKVAKNHFVAELSPDMFEDLGLGIGSEVFVILKLKWLKTI